MSITSKKIVAVALSAAMCLGLSMTAFAAKDTSWTIEEWESPDYMTQTIGPKADLLFNGTTELRFRGLKWATDNKGNRIEYTLSQISEGTWESIKDEGKVQKIFADAGYAVNDKMDFVPLATGTITFDDGVPAGGANLTFSLTDLHLPSDTVKAGDVIYVMQETSPGSGVWDILPATVMRDPTTGDYQASVTVPRNGALVVVKVMSNGDVITLDKTTGEVVDRQPANAAAGTSTSAATSASPKTGEF